MLLNDKYHVLVVKQIHIVFFVFMLLDRHVMFWCMLLNRDISRFYIDKHRQAMFYVTKHRRIMFLCDEANILCLYVTKQTYNNHVLCYKTNIYLVF